MVKYILAGGNDRRFDDYGRRLGDEIYKSVVHPAKILSCFFADPEPWQWEPRARDWELWLRKYLGDDIIYTSASTEVFLDQIRANDVVYFHGGDNEAIISRMRAYPDIRQFFGDKVVIGSSAGANYLSRRFWTRSTTQVANGAGIVPANVMVHYGSPDGGFSSGSVDWHEADAKMDSVANGEPVLRLKEGEYTVIEQ